MNKPTRTFLVIAVIAMLVAGCGDEPQTDAPGAASQGEGVKETAVEHARKHLDPTWVCPMHPQIARGEPGSCPICGMDLVAVEQEGAEETGERKILYYRHPH
ncbi:MAG: hypothetical protein JSW10_12825, partial [Pseudomonadota bacterium]